MANIDAPFGLRPVSSLTGAPYNGQARKYYIGTGDGTNMFIGQPVKLGGTADTLGKYASIVPAATGDYLVGVIVGFDPLEGAGASQAGSTLYRALSTERYAYVADDPNLIFEIQEASGGTALAVTAVGLNADFVVTSAGNTATGLSGVELDNSTEATTAEDLHILGISPSPGNAVGEHCVWLVRINLHQHRYSTGIS